MLRLETAELRRQGEEAIRQGGYTPILSVKIGDVEYGSRFSAWSRKQGEGPAWTLDATVSGRLPRRLKYAPIVATVDVGTVRFPYFRGTLRLPRRDKDAPTTKILAHSHGEFLSEVEMGRNAAEPARPIEYRAAKPHSILRNAIKGRLAYPGPVRIAAIEKPLLTFEGSEGFERSQKVSDLFGKVEGPAGYLYRDTQEEGLDAIPDPGSGEGKPVAWEYGANDPGVVWSPPEPEDEPFTEIEAHRLGPQGGELFRRRARVDLSAYSYPPPVPIPRHQEVPEGMTAPEAGRYVRSLARTARFGADGGSLSVPTNFFLQKGDVLFVRDEDEDDEARYSREWLLVAGGLSDDQTLRQTITGRATLLLETRVDPVVAVPGRRSSGLRRRSV